MKIEYQIEFYSYWHCGSGLAAGADVDSLVVKDERGLPFIPGKTIKGLIRQAVEEISLFADNYEEKKSLIDETFEMKDGELQSHCAFFGNAELKPEEADFIKANNLEEFIFRSVSNTEIGKDGVAKKHSLRKMQVSVPCTLMGSVDNVPSEIAGLMCDAMMYIKRLGLNRNRGLGRCKFTILKEGGDQ